MSGPVGRIAASFGTARNENSVSLANLNFDFTLVKFEAPKEFAGLGNTISRRRKFDAEDGPLHKTARKLGALFDNILPKTPALLRAYGTRVSAISANPAINPQASEKQGMFAGQIGADSTTIWAAVTSGPGAIAVHLLACMLARMFTGPEATSVWVELVEKHKEKIQSTYEDDMYQCELDSAMLAAQQELSRTELGIWDASARAWIQSADLAMARQHKQMMLILENISLSVNKEPAVYDSVVKAWIAGLQAMDSLVRGIPQQVQVGAAVLAISSWHLYPDMVVVGSTATDVQQKDPLFSETSILTLGLETTGERSVSWSLPLSRLLYYGRPVHASRSMNQENSRITGEQFAYVVLGCVLSQWKGFADTHENGIGWLKTIASLLKPLLMQDAHQSRHSFASLWPNYLCNAAERFDACDEIDQKISRQLMALGARRSSFLYPLKLAIPLFGLSELSTLVSLMRNDELRITYLRKLSTLMKLSHTEYVIGYRTKDYSPKCYATIEPLNGQYLRGTQRSDEILKLGDCSGRNTRWLKICEESQRYKRGDETVFSLTDDYEEGEHYYTEAIESIGEDCLPVLVIAGGQLAFGYGNDFTETTKELRAQNARRYLGIGLQDISALSTVQLSFFAGDRRTAAIYRIDTGRPSTHFATLTPDLLQQTFSLAYFSRTKVTNYLLNIKGRHANSVAAEVKSLQVCSAIGRMYSLLPDATISTRIFLVPLNSAKWIPRDETAWASGGLKLSRAQAFACISHLDSGTCNVDPNALDEVFAMSTGNSIYVMGSLLCDPHQTLESTEIRRVVGNVGRAGISLLIAPPQPKIQEPDLTAWREINHYDFDGTAADGFKSTSIHLSFTAYEMPLKLDDNQHTIDRPISLVETLISVYDRGKWVADLDVIGTLDPGNPTPLVRVNCECDKQGTKNMEVTLQQASEMYPRLVSKCIDNWEELLDPPQVLTVVNRAHQNWLGRLALASVCCQLGFETVILPNHACWSCLISAMHEIPSYEIRREEYMNSVSPAIGSAHKYKDDDTDDTDDDDDDDDGSTSSNVDATPLDTLQPIATTQRERSSIHELGNTRAQIAIIW
jgi:hypothetical protein